jgi:hypothetical protein
VVERKFDTVAMMDVDVDVQHARMVPMTACLFLRVGTVSTAYALKQLQDSEHSVVNVAKSICLATFRVMKTSGPIDCSVCRSGGKLARASERRTGVHLAELEHICEYWTILNTIEGVNKVLHFILVPRCHSVDDDTVST